MIPKPISIVLHMVTLLAGVAILVAARAGDVVPIYVWSIIVILIALSRFIELLHENRVEL